MTRKVLSFAWLLVGWQWEWKSKSERGWWWFCDKRRASSSSNTNNGESIGGDDGGGGYSIAGGRSSKIIKFMGDFPLGSFDWFGCSHFYNYYYCIFHPPKSDNEYGWNWNSLAKIPLLNYYYDYLSISSLSTVYSSLEYRYYSSWASTVTEVRRVDVFPVLCAIFIVDLLRLTLQRRPGPLFSLCLLVCKRSWLWWWSCALKLVGTIPFIRFSSTFNDKSWTDINQGREYLVLYWSVLLCVYVLHLIMGVWLLAATREVYSEYTVGNCQVWFYVALFSLVFYTGELAQTISDIYSEPTYLTVNEVIFTMAFHAAKIIYRAFTLMIVNNFLYDLCRPVYRYLSQGSYQYNYYYRTRSGNFRLPSRTSMASTAAFQRHANPTYNYCSTYPQPPNRTLNASIETTINPSTNSEPPVPSTTAPPIAGSNQNHQLISRNSNPVASSSSNSNPNRMRLNNPVANRNPRIATASRSNPTPGESSNAANYHTMMPHPINPYLTYPQLPRHRFMNHVPPARPTIPYMTAPSTHLRNPNRVKHVNFSNHIPQERNNLRSSYPQYHGGSLRVDRRRADELQINRNRDSLVGGTCNIPYPLFLPKAWRVT